MLKLVILSVFFSIVGKIKSDGVSASIHVQNEKLTCYSCASSEASDCDILKAASLECPVGFKKCIAFTGINNAEKSLFFRSCSINGDCESQILPNLQLKQCRTCDTLLCNNDTFAPVQVQDKKLSCYSCRSYDPAGCDTSAAKRSECPGGYPMCIAFSAANSRNKTVYFRSCFKGDCDTERRDEPNVKLKQCRACNTPLCNDDAFE